MSSQESKRAWGWVLGLVILVAPWMLLEYWSSKALDAWSTVYVAGAVGGLALELVRNAWRVEEPSNPSLPGEAPEGSFAPYGNLVDIGIFGRMVTGAIAAPTFLVIVNSIDGGTQDLSSLATSLETVAWGVAVGFASPAVWTMIEGFVKARGDLAKAALEAQLEKDKARLAEAQLRTVKTQVDAGQTAQAKELLAVIVKPPTPQGNGAGDPEKREEVTQTIQRG